MNHNVRTILVSSLLALLRRGFRLFRWSRHRFSVIPDLAFSHVAQLVRGVDREVESAVIIVRWRPRVVYWGNIDSQLLH
jgi:hypothetical protein